MRAERYDRALLLHGALRNEVLTLADVRQYGRDSFGDPDYVCVYGMKPSEWHARGVRLLGRTAVECTRDDLADAIARDVAAVAATAAVPRCLVVDPFAGSGNTLYWLTRRLPGSRGVGFELDDGVFRLTRQNLAASGSIVEIVHTDYRAGLRALAPRDDELLVTFVAPPWGTALHPTDGLDLRRTEPPVSAIVDFLFATFPAAPILAIVQVYEHVDLHSRAEVAARFDWATSTLYDLNAPGGNHGVILASKRWVPAPGRPVTLEPIPVESP